MTAIRKISCYCLFVLLGLLPACLNSFAQSSGLDANKWVEELNTTDNKGNINASKLDSMLTGVDSLATFKFLSQLSDKGQSKAYHIKARINYIWADQLRLKNFDGERLKDDISQEQKLKVKELLSEAMDLAYRSEDDYLIASISLSYAQIIYQYGEISLAVMYCVNGIELYEKLLYPISPNNYQFAAEMVYKVREYGTCIKYAQKAAMAWRNDPDEFKPFTVSCINTVALGYHRQQRYDSALIFYKQALQYPEQNHIFIWEGIVSGNIGQIYYVQKEYDTAYALLKKDYRISKDSGIYDNAANSLQWAARVSLARGNTFEALTEVREAYQLLRLWPDAAYLRNAYYTTTQIFRKLENYDSAFYYNNLYITLNDSLEKIVSISSLNISKARLNNETSKYNIQRMNREKRAQLLLRNSIIAGIILMSMIGLLIINRKRLKTKQEKEKVEQEKLLMELEIASARDQLEMFTEFIVEKTNLIEKLELQVKGKEATAEQQVLISELSQQTILTEEDWNRFKSLFEKIYPGFFIKLKEKFPDVTLAEQRMAALIRLHLTTKQMASMLGISIDSVHKSKQRLRQRLQISSEVNLEENILAF